MAESQSDSESLHYSIGILGISAGSLLLLVNYYASTPNKTLIPATALGIELIIIAALVAYAGLRRSLSHSFLYTTLCLTVSALWCGSGLVHIIAGEDIIRGENALRNAMVPGLAAFTLALLIISLAAILQKKVFICFISLAICLACAHEIAGLANVNFGQSATAACYLLVCCLSAYFGIGRLLFYISHGKIHLPGTGLLTQSSQQSKQGQQHNNVIGVGLIMNLLSASVIACPLLGVVPILFTGHVPWLWTAGVFQLGVSILSYRSMDTLTATFYGFTAILKFSEGYCALVKDLTNQVPYSPVPFPTVFAVLFFVLGLFSCIRSLVDGLYLLFFVAYSIAIAAQPRGFFQEGTQGVQAAIFVVSSLMLLVILYNHVAQKKIPTGENVLKNVLGRTNKFTLRTQDKDLHAPYLGFSKYADAEVLGHGCSVLAAFAITASVANQDPLALLILPWAVVSGGVLQLLCGSVAFARGKTLESTTFIFYGIMWTVWGLTRFGGLYGDVRGFHLAVGIISFMVFNVLVAAGALFLNIAWFVYAVTFELILLSFLLDALGTLPYGYDIGVTIIFGLVSFYFFLANILNCTFESLQLPLGGPLIKLNGFGGGRDSCPHLSSKKVSSVRQIADIMKNGGICGVPTDTVYVLVAACNRPDAVEKAYKVKKQAQERPMSLWLSSIKQLEPVKEQINPLLWDFMEVAWPSSISLVIPRAPWMEFFGLHNSSKYIGTPQSIAIRNPDCTVVNHLISLVGPIAVTSANPTGEADTTHHNQVYAKLGDKVDGVLCDGPSPENIASTVVDCTKIESGQIGFFRVGLIPKSKVLALFEEIQKKHQNGYTNRGFETDINDSQAESTESETDSGFSQQTPADSSRSSDPGQHNNTEHKDKL
ncbi:YrdC domain-containing protein, mitochondrial [Bagarius yarrelli]|uniref:Threonylcarbamoyl-AMP synthase n=1 Tax=Bagarius yarrelli TaxID=175774 RepID=A0A556U1T1_BAGYA|nr:YrdC domain-containing protein, mitochondrial [Bagarius yarrelli]